MGRAEEELVEGYMDGFKDTRDALPELSNRSEAYQHGWLNGRDDRIGQPRASASELRAIADRILAEEYS